MPCGPLSTRRVGRLVFRRVHSKGVQDGSGIADVQFVVALVRPLLAQVAARPVNGLGHVREVLLGVEAIDDLDGVGEVLAGDVPDPLHHTTAPECT